MSRVLRTIAAVLSVGVATWGWYVLATVENDKGRTTGAWMLAGVLVILSIAWLVTALVSRRPIDAFACMFCVLHAVLFTMLVGGTDTRPPRPTPSPPRATGRCTPISRALNA